MTIENKIVGPFNDITVNGIVVYSFFANKLIKYYGNAYFREPIGVHGAHQVNEVSNIIGRFYTILPNGKKKHICICSKSGIIYNRTVWFEEDHDDEAKELFIKYEWSKILELERRIDKHKETIELINKGE